MIACAVTPADAFARAPKSAAPIPPAEQPAPAAASAEEVSAPDVDPATVSEADAAANADAAHLHDEATEAAPSTAERVLAIRQVQTMVGLFGRGVLVNDDAEEPPTTPVSVRVRPTKRAGAAFSFTFAF